MLLFMLAYAAFEIGLKLSADIGIAILAGALVLCAIPFLAAENGIISRIIMWPLDYLIRAWLSFVYSSIRIEEKR
jgi:hypothetical protein